MAVVDKKGALNLANLDSSPSVMVNAKTSNGALVKQVEYVAVASGDDNNSIYRIARVPSNAVISKLSTLYHTAITGGTDYNIGFAYANGAVIDDNALIDADDFSSAGSVALLSSIALTNIGKEVWELAGLTADPHGLIDIIATGITVGTADGTIACEVIYSY